MEWSTNREKKMYFMLLIAFTHLQIIKETNCDRITNFTNNKFYTALKKYWIEHVERILSLQKL